LNPSIENQTVREFWDRNPVAANSVQGITPGTADYFKNVDRLREEAGCEPFDFSETIHEYSQSAGKAVLDIGCGHGYVLSRYATYGAKVFGIDLTQRALELTQKRFDLLQFKGDFRQTDGNSIPHPDKSFDIVCCMGVLHHIADPSPMLREISRVLRPGGQVILMFYNRRSFRNYVTFPWRKFFGPPAFRGKTLQKIRNMNDGADCPLALVYSKTEVQTLIESYFRDIRFIVNKLPYEELFIHHGIGRRLAHFLPSPSENLLARHWGWNLYVKAKKI
jgi:2-polyprenyl-3-methyl-5-hydroxy-6-metoxy-1,4-benzoquinol methylase